MKKITALLLFAAILMGNTGALAKDWSDDAYTALNGKGVLEGVPVTVQNKNEAVTRGDFAVITDRVLGLSDKYSCTLSDVSDSDRCAASVKRLITNGIAKGVSNDSFNPEGLMTRQEMAVFLVSAYEYKKGSAVLYDDVLSDYKDSDKVADWAFEAVNKAVFKGIMTGTDDGVFDPGGTVTKEQAVRAGANLIMNIMEIKPNLVSEGDTYIEQTVRGNSFYEDEEVRFIIHTNQKSFKWEVRDFWKRTVYSGFEEAKDGIAELSLDMKELGYFELSLYGDDADGKTKTLLTNSFTRVTRYNFDAVNPEDSFFGVCTALRKNPTDVLEDALNREIRMLGAKSVRDGSEWKSVEREKGVYTPQLNDVTVQQMAKKYNMDYLYVGGLDNLLYDVNEKTKAAQTPYTDNGREGYANFMRWLALFDNGFYKHLNLYNEWNGTGFGKRGGSPADCKPEMYHLLAKKTYETVKAASPDTILAGPSFAGGGFEAGGVFMEELGKLGTLKYLDIVAGNAYNVTTTPDYIAERFTNIDNIVKKYNNGQSKPIWITETGYPTYADITENMAGEYTIPLFVNAISAGVERIFWYNLADYGIDPNNKEDHFGLMRFPTNELGAHTLKPSFSALAVLAREITGFDYGENKSRDGYFHHTFKKDGEIKNVLWAYEKKNISVPAIGALKLTDFMGNVSYAEPSGGSVMLTLENDPIFIEGEFGDISAAESFNIECRDTAVKNSISADIKLENVSGEVYAVIDGKKYELHPSEGKVSETIILPAKAEAGEYDIIAKIFSNGAVTGVIKGYVNIAEPYDITVVPEITNIRDKKVTLNVKLKNNKAEEARIQELCRTLGSETETIPVNETIAPYETKDYKLETKIDSYGVKYRMEVNAVVDYRKQDKADVSRVVEFNPNAKLTVEQGADVHTVLKNAPVLDLSEGTFVPLSGGSHRGENDLGGNMWLTWDEQNLYFTAEIKDDMHETPKTGEQIWANDSIQMALALDENALGEEFDKLIDLQTQKDPNFSASNRSNYYEFSISDTSEGPTVWVHKDVKTGGVSYRAEQAEAAVKRDEKAKTTTYWVKFPWESLPPMDPEKVPEMMMSVLVNDCDSGIRKGFIEWGSGIGTSKNKALFKTFQFVNGAE